MIVKLFLKYLWPSRTSDDDGLTIQLSRTPDSLPEEILKHSHFPNMTLWKESTILVLLLGSITKNAYYISKASLMSKDFKKPETKFSHSSTINFDKRFLPKLCITLDNISYTQNLINIKQQTRCGLMLNVLGVRRNWDQVRSLERGSNFSISLFIG